MRKGLIVGVAAALLVSTGLSTCTRAQTFYSMPLGSDPSGTEVLGPIRQGSNDVTLPSATIVGKTPFTRGSSLVGQGAGTSLARLGYFPEDFKKSADGTDDAPSINRAETAAASNGAFIRYGCHVYTLATPIVQSGIHVDNIGCGWQEPYGGSISSGTVFHVTFTGQPVIQISGNGSSHSRWRDIAAYEDQPAAASSWTPNSYGYLFDVEKVGAGVDIEGIMCMNCTLGFKVYLSGRTILRDLFGQYFQQMVYSDKNYDSSIMDNLHQWPWWSQDANVLKYQLANLDTYVLGRVDDLMSSSLFTYGAHSGMKLITTAADGSNGGGALTNFHCGLCKFEASKWGIWSTVAPNYYDEGSMRIDLYSYQGQDPTSSSVAAISGASAFRQDGWQTQVSIGLLKVDFIDQYLIDNPGTAATNFMVDQGFLNFSHGQTNVYYLNSGTLPSLLAFALVPQAYAPSGTTVGAQPSGGKGTVSWPALTPR